MQDRYKKGWITRKKKYGSSGGNTGHPSTPEVIQQRIATYKKTIQRQKDNGTYKLINSNKPEATKKGWITRRQKYGPSGGNKGYPRTKATREKMSEKAKIRMRNCFNSFTLKRSKPELKLEKIMINNNICGFKHFIPVKGFYPDFINENKKIIIEVDGVYWHSLPCNIKRDKQKNYVYKSNGYKVLRLTDIEVNQNPDYCLNEIKNTIFEEGLKCK